jgi:chemotaxis protein histidine kinase CheA
VEGTEGIIKGFELNKRSVIVEVTLELPDTGPQLVTHSVASKNLMLLKDYNLLQAGASGSKDLVPKETPDSKRKAPPAWILDGHESARVKTEKNWHKLVSDDDPLNKTFWLRGRIAVCLEALHETLPTYTDKDLVVCHRQNEKGVWKDELWTNRAFGPEELVFAPQSSQLKDSHLTTEKHAVLGLPKHGKGKHPEDKSFALDGRTRLTLAHTGSLDEHEHTGSLFWIVARSSEATDANMTLESVNYDMNLKLNLPYKTTRASKKSVEWASNDLPSIPILVNKKKIQEHVRLVVFHRDKKEEKEATEAEAEEKTKEEKAKEEKAKDKKAKEQKAKEQKAKEEKAQDKKAKEEKAKQEKAKEEKAQDKKAKEEKAKQEKARTRSPSM